MNMQMLVRTGLLCIIQILKLFILTVLELNMFLKELKNSLDIKKYTFRIQAHNATMCGYFCIGFIKFMLAGKTLIEHTSLFLKINEFH